MDLHNLIMNIRVDEQNLFYKYGNESLYAYKEGHRDARHSAAELSLKADARIEDLEAVLKGLLNESHTATKPLHPHSEWSIKAMKVLEE